LKINERQAQKLGVTALLSAQKKKIIADVKDQIESRRGQRKRLLRIQTQGASASLLNHRNQPEKIYSKLILADSEIDLERT
jgi:hypothetical protein